METKINDDLIHKTCINGVIKYLSEHHDSVQISGKSIETLDASLNPQRNELYPDVTPKYVLTDIIKKLKESKESNITFDLTCSLYAVSTTKPTGFNLLNVEAKNIDGKLLLLSDDRLDLIISSISFQPHNSPS